LYVAVVDEAHKNGLRVTAHIFTLEDAKGVLRAGVDAFGHSVRDCDVDDEFIPLVRQHPNLVVNPNLPPTPVRWRPARAPISSCSTPIHWTTSPTRGVSRRYTCEVRQSTARGHLSIRREQAITRVIRS